MKEKRVLITGGSKRLGQHLTENLAKQGHDLIIHYNKSHERANKLKDKLTKEYPHQAFSLLQSDLNKVENLDSLISQATEYFGNIDVLINNAAMFEYDMPLEFSTTKLMQHLTVNSVAPMILMRDFVKLTKTKMPIAINILDSKVGAINPDYFSYTVSKLALKNFMELCSMATIGNEKIYGVAPSMLLESGKPTQGRVEELTKINLLEEVVPLEAVSDAVNFLISGLPCNGQILYVDAGQHMMGLPRDVAFLENEE